MRNHPIPIRVLAQTLVLLGTALWAVASSASPEQPPRAGEAPRTLPAADGGPGPREPELEPAAGRPAEPPAVTAVDAGSPGSDAAPVYVPPQRGAPATRVGGGTRNADGGAPTLRLLSPEHTGLTTAASPTLYWYLSQAHRGPFEVVVTDRHAVTPALRLRLTDLEAGIHRLALADHGVTLAPDRVYQWSVSLVRDERHRARDIVALAGIERVRQPHAGRNAGELAAAGLWYDAIHAASDPILADARAALLDQVGLGDAAAWDRQRADCTPAAVTASC